MEQEYILKTVRAGQEECRRATEAQNILRLLKKVNDAKAELEEAQLQRQNRMNKQIRRIEHEQ